MENTRCKILFLSFQILTSILAISSSSTSDEILKEKRNLETYIVLLMKPDGHKITESQDLDSWYKSYLPANTIRSDYQPRLIHSYQHVVTGFSAKLTADEAKAIEMNEEVVLVRPQMRATLHTTHTPSFLGLQQNQGFWKKSNYGKGVIIGLIDSGITPNHPSFSDEGMPSPPTKWKGKCELKGKFSCNNKLIGARNFASDSNDLVDRDIHGTHTASIAAGSPVHGVSYFGLANGTAMGIAPLAHLAMYKISATESGESELLAAMDAAVGDGVDVLSLSVGFGNHPFYNSTIAIAAFAAIRKGIFVSCSAGNSGPYFRSLENDAPWILTVGASTVDRAMRATVKLGNKVELNGESFFQPKSFRPKLLPLVYAGANGKASSASCEKGSLKNVNVKDKIVLCEGIDDQILKGQEVKDNGGAAMIVMSTEDVGGLTTEPALHVLPASNVNYIAGSKIKAYMKSTSSPKATVLFKGTVYGLPEAPQVAWFSSRGPSRISPRILKPDIIGPGLRILGAWPYSIDNTSNNRFEFLSGTSMSCPHLSGVAALLKTAHPDWSPAAIKSAIITTANLHNLGGKRITDDQFLTTTLFETGAGHVNPSAAHNPGLIYDIKPEDYIPYLCGLGYSNKYVSLLVHQKVKCSKNTSIPEGQLNYPSFSIELESSPQTYTRTVTNVGKPYVVYSVEIIAPYGVDVMVIPCNISFNKANHKATYSITFAKTKKAQRKSYTEGSVSWVGEGYNVRSPIAVLIE